MKGTRARLNISQERVANDLDALDDIGSDIFSNELSSEYFTPKRIGKNVYNFKKKIILNENISSVVKPHSLNPRVQSLVNKAALKELSDDIKDIGLIELPVALYKDGVYYTLDGSRRVKAILELGDDLTVAYTDEDVTVEDIGLFIKSTYKRESLSVYEEILRLKSDYDLMKRQMSLDSNGKIITDSEFINKYNAEMELEGTPSELKRSRFSNDKKIWSTITPDLFDEYAVVNKFTKVNLMALSRLSEAFKEGDAFKVKFLELSKDLYELGKDWSGDEFVKNLRTNLASEHNIKALANKSTADVLWSDVTGEKSLEVKETKTGWILTSKNSPLSLLEIKELIECGTDFK